MGEVKGCWELFFLMQSNIQKSRQKEYYYTPGTSDKQADSTRFVELMLKIIRGNLKKVTVVCHFADQDRSN